MNRYNTYNSTAYYLLPTDNLGYTCRRMSLEYLHRSVNSRHCLYHIHWCLNKQTRLQTTDWIKSNFIIIKNFIDYSKITWWSLMYLFCDTNIVILSILTKCKECDQNNVSIIGNNIKTSLGPFGFVVWKLLQGKSWAII